MAEWVYLLLGSNEGAREILLRQALDALRESVAVGPMKASSIYETAAWGVEEQPAFLNMAVGMQTTHSPQEVLAVVHSIEEQFGRRRTVIWGQRTLDIDILLLGTRIIDTPDLIIPHPRMQDRRFALVPMNEIAAAAIHPVFNQTVAELLAACNDTLPVYQLH